MIIILLLQYIRQRLINSRALWEVDENIIKIHIKWPSEVSFDRIVLHGNSSNSKESSIRLAVRDDKSGKILAITERLVEFDRATYINFEKTMCDELTLFCESLERNCAKYQYGCTYSKNEGDRFLWIIDYLLFLDSNTTIR